MSFTGKPVLTAHDKQVAIDALTAAIENGTPLNTGSVLGPDWDQTGKVCSCAVVAATLGFNLSTVWERGKDGWNLADTVPLYDFLDSKGFDESKIFSGNDRAFNGGFSGARDEIALMPTYDIDNTSIGAGSNVTGND